MAYVTPVREKAHIHPDGYAVHIAAPMYIQYTHLLASRP